MPEHFTTATRLLEPRPRKGATPPSAREKRAKRRDGWCDYRICLPMPTYEGLCALSKLVAREHPRQGERRKYPRSKNYNVCASLERLLRQMGFAQFCQDERAIWHTNSTGAPSKRRALP
jgi:hypothetical protein